MRIPIAPFTLLLFGCASLPAQQDTTTTKPCPPLTKKQKAAAFLRSRQTGQPPPKRDCDEQQPANSQSTGAPIQSTSTPTDSPYTSAPVDTAVQTPQLKPLPGTIKHDADGNSFYSSGGVDTPLEFMGKRAVPGKSESVKAYKSADDKTFVYEYPDGKLMAYTITQKVDVQGPGSGTYGANGGPVEKTVDPSTVPSNVHVYNTDATVQDTGRSMDSNRRNELYKLNFPGMDSSLAGKLFWNKIKSDTFNRFEEYNPVPGRPIVTIDVDKRSGAAKVTVYLPNAP